MNCKTCKRPPPSLRIRGAPALKDSTKLKMFSLWESELLAEAIKDKQKLVNRLMKRVTIDTPLSQHDDEQIKKHFSKKLDFYNTQNKTKWKDWPNNKKSKKTEANFHRKQKRRKRKTEDDANRALESGSVVILVEKEIPLGALALLGKGLNFTPTPTADIREEQLDMRLNTNRILKAANISRENDSNIKYSVPSKLSYKRYTAAAPAKENSVNNIVQNITEEHNARLQFQNTNKMKKNITKDEQDGLQWLIKETNESNIAVVKADKGGAILIVDPKLLEKAVQDKLQDPNLYEQIEGDPTDMLHNELFDAWVRGKRAEFVTAGEAARVMGVTEDNNKSTSSRFKPGTSYFYPMLKIHKLEKEELKPGVNPPSRLVTALQDGISKRSDVFLADKFLKELEADFCEDLLKDTNDALSWLEEVDETHFIAEKKQMKSFTFDFKSLYDNLKPELVKEAVESAIIECHPGWSRAKRKWIISLIDISLRSSIGKFKDKFYRQKKGVPTGGSLCVQLANITVYYIMRKAVYSNQQLMTNVKEVKRYIDDGAGFYSGSQRSYELWMNAVNEKLQPYGLFIDESSVKEVGEYSPFLDIQFCFDTNGQLQTDLYVKPTDSRAYLHYSSAHPRHTFSGIVYSQCLRLRRIINDKCRLTQRLNELLAAFDRSGYPEEMLCSIRKKVEAMERQLNRHVETDENQDDRPVVIVSCNGTDEKLTKTIKKYEDELSKTNSFKNASKPLFQYVKKTGTNVGSKLSVLKSIALGGKKGETVPCRNHRNCKCCKLIGKNVEDIHGLPVSTAPGTCKTKNVIYLVSCKLCLKPYTGRTVQQVCKRMSGHRECFYKVLRNDEDVDTSNDDFSLGLHLVNEHNCVDREDFNENYNVQILEKCRPSDLEKKEHLYIHKYNTLYPLGLNKINPFGLPVLGT